MSRQFTPAELRVLEVVAAEEGWPYALQHAAGILDEARSLYGEGWENDDIAEPTPRD